jgi:hypothetical protein
MNKPLRYIKFGLFIIWSLCILMGLFYWGSSYLMGTWDPNNKPQLSDVSICLGPNQIDGKPMEPGIDFPKDMSIYFCGYLRTSVPVPLSIIWYRNSDNRQIYSDPVAEKFRQGYIFSRLNQSISQPGSYRVGVFDGRELISSVDFNIR